MYPLNSRENLIIVRSLIDSAIADLKNDDAEQAQEKLAIAQGLAYDIDPFSVAKL